MGSLYKSLIGKEDINYATTGLWPDTFERLSSTGGTIELRQFPDIWNMSVGGLHAKSFGNHDATRATLLAACVSAGTSTQTVIYLDPEDWVIGTDLDLSSYTNVFFHLMPGARFSVANGVTLTLPSPDNIYAKSNQEIFTGTGAVNFAVAGTISPLWYDKEDIGAQINAALVSAVDQMVVEIPAGAYTISTSVVLAEATIGSQCVIRGQGFMATKLTTAAGSGITMFNGTSSDEVTVCNMRILEGSGQRTATCIQIGGTSMNLYNLWLSNALYGLYEVTGAGTHGYNIYAEGNSINFYFNGTGNIQSGRFSQLYSNTGSTYGMRITGTVDELVFTNSRFSAVAANDNVYIDTITGSAIFGNCQFNDSVAGSGANVKTGRAVFNSCNFQDNATHGLYIQGDMVEYPNCIFSGNGTRAVTVHTTGARNVVGSALVDNVSGFKMDKGRMEFWKSSDSTDYVLTSATAVSIFTLELDVQATVAVEVTAHIFRCETPDGDLLSWFEKYTFVGGEDDDSNVSLSAVTELGEAYVEQGDTYNSIAVVPTVVDNADGTITFKLQQTNDGGLAVHLDATVSVHYKVQNYARQLVDRFTWEF